MAIQTTFTPYIPSLGGEGTGSENSAFQNSYINSSGTNLGGTYSSGSSSSSSKPNTPTLKEGNVSGKANITAGKPTTLEAQGIDTSLNESTTDTTLSTTTESPDLPTTELSHAPMDFSFIDARIGGKKKNGLNEMPTLDYNPIDPDTGVKVAGPDKVKTVEDYDNDINNEKANLDKLAAQITDVGIQLDKAKKDYNAAVQKLNESFGHTDIMNGLEKGQGVKGAFGGYRKYEPGEYKSGDTEYSIAVGEDGKVTITDKTNNKVYSGLDRNIGSDGLKPFQSQNHDLSKLNEELTAKQNARNEAQTALEEVGKQYKEANERITKLTGLRDDLDKKNKETAAKAREVELAKKAAEEAKIAEEKKAAEETKKKLEAEIAKSNDKIVEAGKEYAAMDKPKIETPDNLAPAIENTPAIDWKESESYNNLSEDKKNNLSEIEKAYNEAIKVDDDGNVTSIDPEAYKAAQDKHKELMKNEEQNLHTTIMDKVNEMVKMGMNMKDAYKNALASDDVKSAAQQLYDMSQSSLDLAMEVQENLPKVHNKKDVKENSEEWAKITNVSELSKKDVKNIAKYMKGDNYQKLVDANTALTKAAAELGATDTKGGRFSEAWKHQSVDLGRVEGKKNTDNLSGKQKFSIKDILSTVATGTLGTLTTLVGVAIAPENPLLGAAVIGSGVSKLGKSTMGTMADKSVDELTNKQYMFGSGDTYTDVMAGIKKHSDDSAYSGLPTNPQTYENLIGMGFGAMEVLNGALTLDPIQIVDGLTSLKDSIGKVQSPVDKQNSALYDWGKQFYKMMHEDPSILNGLKTPWNGDTQGTSGGGVENAPVVNSSSFGIGSGKLEDELNSSFSGYKEQAKDSNISKDYNEGMEKESNQAVSDKYCKQFRTLFRNEPEVVRKYIIGVVRK